MTTNTITVTGNTQSLSGNIYYNETIIKGRGVVNFDFTGVDTTDNTILRTKIDYGDNSEPEIISYSVGLDHINQPITYYFALYGTYSPLLIKSHTYDPPLNTYFTSLTAKFYLELADTRLINIFFPIKIAQPSYYSEMENINIGATQLICTSESDVFCTLHDKTGDVINIVLS
jgi:hypothetical protein